MAESIGAGGEPRDTSIPAGDEPLDSPRSAEPQEIGFQPQKRVRWLSIGLLLRTAQQVVVSKLFGEFVDRRELQDIYPINPDTLDIIDLSDRAELWIDYVADPADGFNSATAVAALVARTENLVVADPVGHETAIPAAELLVLGGDEAYPTGSRENYVNRMVGPYRSMLSWTPQPRRMVAVPGNHDWYDGLVSFLRTFCQGRWIGGWRTQQKRSYFAVKLPHGWWLWGIDIQFDADIDAPQLKYFGQIKARVQPGDGIILCWANPSWVHAGPRNPEAYAQLEYFERTMVPEHARLRISLSGDTHHYARFEQPETKEQKITAGGGGAYLSATHKLPSALCLPPPQSRDPMKRPPATYRRMEVFPSRARSWWLGLGVLWRIFGNRAFFLVPALMYFVAALQIADARSVLLSGMAGGTAPQPVVFIGLVVAVWFALYLFANGGTLISRRLAATAHLLLHASVLLAVVVLADRRREFIPPDYDVYAYAGVVTAAVSAVIILWSIGVSDHLRGWVRGVLGVVGGAAVIAGVGSAAWWVVASTHYFEGTSNRAFLSFAAFTVGAVVGPVVTAIYLLTASSLLNVNTNELFSAQALQDHKSFLALRVTERGVVIHPIAVDQVPRKWTFMPGRPRGPWFEPDGGEPVPARMIEAAVTVARDPGGGAADLPERVRRQVDAPVSGS